MMNQDQGKDGKARLQSKSNNCKSLNADGNKIVNYLQEKYTIWYCLRKKNY